MVAMVLHTQCLLVVRRIKKEGSDEEDVIFDFGGAIYLVVVRGLRR